MKHHYPCYLALPTVALTLSCFGRETLHLTFDGCPLWVTGPSVRKAIVTFRPIWWWESYSINKNLHIPFGIHALSVGWELL